jgi:hypothetical protein
MRLLRSFVIHTFSSLYKLYEPYKLYELIPSARNTHPPSPLQRGNLSISAQTFELSTARTGLTDRNIFRARLSGLQEPATLCCILLRMKHALHCSPKDESGTCSSISLCNSTSLQQRSAIR